MKINKFNEFNVFELFDSSPLFDFSISNDCGNMSTIIFHRWGGRAEISYYEDSENTIHKRLTIYDETDISRINEKYFCFKNITYRDLLNNGQIIKKGIVFLMSIMSCLVIYYVANALIQKALGVIPGDYKGAERFGSVILEKKFGLFRYIYETLFAILKGNFYGITSKPWLCVLLGGLYVLVAVIWVIQCIRLFRQKRSFKRFS